MMPDKRPLSYILILSFFLIALFFLKFFPEKAVNPSVSPASGSSGPRRACPWQAERGQKEPFKVDYRQASGHPAEETVPPKADNPERRVIDTPADPVEPEKKAVPVSDPVQAAPTVPAYKPIGSVLRTKNCDIVYFDENSLSGFFWRISGRRFDSVEEITIAAPKVDFLLKRVQSILDMYPENLRVTIEIHSEYKEGRMASYSHKTGVIKVYADKITDGILAHEMAHAVICNYFKTRPPAKMQEILTQYVDRHLWSDYE